jgi:hypothetical protein
VVELGAAPLVVSMLEGRVVLDSRADVLLLVNLWAKAPEAAATRRPEDRRIVKRVTMVKERLKNEWMSE